MQNIPGETQLALSLSLVHYETKISLFPSLPGCAS